MRIPGRNEIGSCRGLSRTEVLVLAFGMGLLASLVFLMFQRSRAMSQLSICKSNLMRIGTGMELFANVGKEPAPPQPSESQAPPPSLARLSKMIQGLSDPRLLFICPSDAEAIQGGPNRPTGLTISYFISDEAVPEAWSLLAGDRNLTRNGSAVVSGILEIAPNASLGWTEKVHRFQGNVALGDGSVQTKDATQLAEYLRQARGPQSIVIP